MTTTFYPESPALSTKKLTSLTPSYQFRALLAILAIILFFVLYTTLILSLGYLVYYTIIYDMGSINKFTILMKLGAIIGAAMLFAFTLKFIFKLKNHRPSNRIKLDKQDHHELWGFVNQICKETGAPQPKSIYVDPDVNAYVCYTNMWLSLFLPVQKELTIGMGLLDCLNLSEFKAVISHEFGHFAQRSMKIGSYIISANTIIHDMIFARDKWDDLLDKWRASDLRFSAAAWAITPIIWIIRQILKLFYQFLNIMNSSLSREMEFNADKVAVSTSGSDAIVSALWKLDGGSTNWNSTINYAYLASQKKEYVKNLYAHNGMAVGRGAEQQQESLSGLPDDLRGGKLYFSNSEVSKVSMYASHPPNDKREKNAKTPYIACAEDSRSPWILFGKKETLQEDMTALIYNEYLGVVPVDFVAPQAFENFIKGETQGSELMEEYGNTFENRFLHIPEIGDLEEKAQTMGSPDANSLQKLKMELNTLMGPITELELLMQKARQIAEGTTKENILSVHGITYTKKNVGQGYEYLLRQREQLFNEAFTDWDIAFCSLHYNLAKQKAKEVMLLDRYNQHRGIVKIYRSIMETKGAIYQKVADLQAEEEVTHGRINALTYQIEQSINKLNEEMEGLATYNFVPMPNIETWDELQNAIVGGGTFKHETGNIFENGGFDKMMNTIENAAIHCQRIDQKSIRGILEFHKEILKEAGVNG